MSRIGTERAFEVPVRARALEAQGRDVIHLEIGEPDFPTPRHIVEDGQKTLDDGWTHYGPTQGYLDLREAVAAQVSRTLGTVPVPMPLFEERGFVFDLDLLRTKLSSRTRLLILNSPENPAGGVIPPEDIRAIADLVRERDMMVLADGDLLAHRLWPRAAVHRQPAGRAREDHHPVRLLEHLRHDRLAHRLRRQPRVGGQRHQLPDGQLQLLHRQFHPARRFGRTHQTSVGDREDVGRVAPPPGCLLRRPEFAARHPLPPPGRRVLCLREHHRNANDIVTTGRRPSGASRSRLPQRRGVRRSWRRLSPLQLRELVPTAHGGRGTHRSLLEQGGLIYWPDRHPHG